MIQRIFASFVLLLMFSNISNAAGCQSIAQVEANMSKSGYKIVYEGDSDKTVNHFIHVYTLYWCGNRECQTDNVKASHVRVYSGKDDRAVFFNKKGCKSYTLVRQRNELIEALSEMKGLSE